MKEYEKLAWKQGGYHASTGNEHLDMFIREKISYGFEMGFLKCREMAVSDMDFRIGSHYELHKLGEKEV